MTKDYSKKKRKEITPKLFSGSNSVFCNSTALTCDINENKDAICFAHYKNDRSNKNVCQIKEFRSC